MAPHSRTLAWKIPWTEEPGIVKQSDNFTRIGIIFLNIAVKTLSFSMVPSYPPNFGF